MAKRTRRTARLSPKGIESLPQDKPAVCKILDKHGVNIYTGVAKRRWLRDRLSEHLPGGPDPIRGGCKVRIDQKSSINEAQESERRIIKRSKPKFNKQGK